jgi:hypothetical protein
MKRENLEHIIRVAAAITNEYEIIIFGSQSILGAVPFPPEELTYSVEADIYPRNRPELADLIDGTIGEGSPFHETYTYYAQGVGPETAILPEGWEERLVVIQNQNTDLKKGLCLEPHDLAAAKLAAGRDKDWIFVEHMLAYGIVEPMVLVARIETLPFEAERRRTLSAWVRAKSAFFTSADSNDRFTE